MDTNDISKIKELLDTAQHVLIATHEHPTFESVGSALSLSLGLVSLGKKVTVVCPDPMTVALSSFIGVNKVVQAISNKNFIISLDYVEGSIEKVSYNIEGDKFNLVIEPKTGSQSLFNEKNVHYSSGGLAAGMIITLGAAGFETLGKVYEENRDVFARKAVVVIDHNPANKQYGRLNIVRPASSCSEIVAQLIKTAGWPLNGDMASNLYDGVVSGSRNFSSPQVNASTFEAAAWLLRSGARKSPPAFTRSEELPTAEFAGLREEEKQLPPDWLKPKIFKGSGGMSGGGLL